MEHGSYNTVSDVEVLEHVKNGVVIPTMENIPDGTITVSKDEKVVHIEDSNINGDSITESTLFEDDPYSSESDALVIDETVPKKQSSGKKSAEKNKTVSEDSCSRDGELITHSNPYFNESLFELSQLHKSSQDDSIKNDTNLINISVDNDKIYKIKNKKIKGKIKPKVREFAQYLGLQPTVQFKCSKCGRAGFESLTTLQDHIIQCNSVQTVQQTIPENSCSGFKLTRKVFLCSACGTYYENWNLYMHMLEFHRRYICLYCLGMFSILEDLCQHIQSRHNLEPGHKNSLDEFFNVYNEPCYIVCCECNKLFSEQDNFFYHSCVSSKNSRNKKSTKQHITPENHVTGDSIQLIEETSAGTKVTKQLQNVVQNVAEKVNIPNQNTDKIIVTQTDESNKNLKNRSGSDVCDGKVSNEENDHIKFCNDLDTNQDSEELDLAKNTVKGSELSDLTEAIPFQESRKQIEEIFQENFLQEDNMEVNDSDSEPIETRKVPKLSLKLPKLGSFPEDFEAEESDDSEKLTVEVNQIESENDNDSKGDNFKFNGDDTNLKHENVEPLFQIAGADITIIELQLEQPLDKFDPRVLLQKCLKATSSNCIYCNHARKIAVDGKQLGLHCIAEHRFSGVVNSITAEELIPENFVHRIKESLDDLEKVFFNLESSFSDEAVTFSHVFECFQCRFSTTIHKELYLHNRKFHSKNLLLCIMCKSNFYSYSELICHLCPGVYILDYDLQFRCCMCVNDDLPSSFRLMVHLRKKHNVCDVCLEMCHTQYRLSNHVWKHKLHHFCYRCGIAYRNKPDITRHLFWKHGTESVLCKKCLQKKWPHVYHFCVPPTTFTCEECNIGYTKAVSLKVHKRIHTNEKKHACMFEGCTKKFISKKLMLRHELRHTEPSEVIETEKEIDNAADGTRDEKLEEKNLETIDVEEKGEDKPKPKIDVLDLPELNLSESDSSDTEEETISYDKKKKSDEDETTEDKVEGTLDNKKEYNQLFTEEEKMDGCQKDREVIEDLENPNSMIQNIWNNFKNYQASKEKLDNMFSEVEKTEASLDIPLPVVNELTVESALRDHDYCVDPGKTVDTSLIEVKPALTMTESVDHDYCSPKTQGVLLEKPTSEIILEEKSKEDIKEKKSSDSSCNDSSNDSDSSSCSCGSNCSCSSSSDSSSSTSESSNSDSSTEDGRKRQQARRQRRKERANKLHKENHSKVVDVVATDFASIAVEAPIRESDLETTESDTDEEFYDRAPQKLAKKIFEEKRQQLLAIMGPNEITNGNFIESTSRPPTPPVGIEEEENKPKKKSKSKKRKKRKSERRNEIEIGDNKDIASETANIPVSSYYHQLQTVTPATLSISQNSPTSNKCSTSISVGYPKVHSETSYIKQDSSDSSLRASKRRRVPNKFYGYSSDEDQDKVPTHMPKWRKTEVPPTPRLSMVVPPITIKTTPQPVQQPTVEPISIRTGTHLSDFRVQRPRPKHVPPSVHVLTQRHLEKDSATESNDSSSEEQQVLPKLKQPQLYCYCRCPYDEVSEMIGCDANDCAIEWFHFECVGIMVPPKGQWFCPDCRKKKQQRRELLQT